MSWYDLSKDEVLKRLEVNFKKGLQDDEAKRRLEQNGPNKLSEKKKKTILGRFLSQFSDFMVMILLAAAAISLAMSMIDGDADFVEPVLILAIVVLNAVMGVAQETRAEHSMEALRKLSSPRSKVLRDGERLDISSEELVCGDIVFYESGDWITADGRILEDAGLRVEESSLTGESLPVDKSAHAIVGVEAALGERYNMVYSGSAVVSGRCAAVVTATGMETEVGKIADLLNSSDAPQTPLQKRLEYTGKTLGITAICACALIFAMGMLQKTAVLDSFLLSVSLAVAAVPEGLPAIVTIVLALGVQRMARKNAIVRRLPAVETLGAATVICSDKTGTLTQNIMTVRAVRDARGQEADSEIRDRLLSYGALCTNTQLEKDGDYSGDPTETAIVRKARDFGIIKDGLEREFCRVGELPFDSSRKLMTTIHSRPQGGFLIITKGAPEVLVRRCVSIGGSDIRKMTPDAFRRIMDDNGEMARAALRVIAVAYRIVDRIPDSRNYDKTERELIFLGQIGMMDPPRPEARAAVSECRRAGIKPVMITGDHALTAAAIATELGILRDKDSGVISGSELDNLPEKEQKREIIKHSVFARVTPEHKTLIVRALQENGEIVAMTGDGVNDAPALKAADIGCAMGKGGTDVARGASDMVLTDDNFSTIISAVREGRGIYQNILKTVHFLLSCNIGEILTIFAAFMMGRPSPLLPIQLLWINLVTDSLPALAFGAEKIDNDIMRRKPLNPKSGMFSGGRGLDIVVQGIMIGVISLLAYEIGSRGAGFTAGRTYAFAVLSFSQLVHAFNVRSNESIFSVGLFSNLKMTGAFILCCAMQAVVISIPALSEVFGTIPLSLLQWREVICLSIIPLAAIELSKLLGRTRKETSIADYRSTGVR